MKTYTLEDIKCANRAHGGHYFEPATMRFFRSRIAPGVHQGVGGIYFVTSEQFNASAPRLYSVSRFVPGERCIERASEFQQFSNLRQARRFADKLAAAE